MKTKSKYLELSEILERMESISKIMPLVVSYCEVKKEYWVRAGNICVYAPSAFRAYQMFVNAFDRFNEPDTLSEKIEELNKEKDEMFESIANLTRPDNFLRKGN